MKIIRTLLLVHLVSLCLVACEQPEEPNITEYVQEIALVNGSYLIQKKGGEVLRITPYGEAMVRVQSVRKGEAFFSDDRYEMVESHDWPKHVSVRDEGAYWALGSPADSTLEVRVDKKTKALSFVQEGTVVLTEKRGTEWKGDTIAVEFNFDNTEHFTGLGHGYFGRASSVHLKGQTHRRNYGKAQIEQAPLIVPFYMSSKGYGFFLNSTFSNEFVFGEDEQYRIAIDDSGFGGRMDYFFIAGPQLKTVLDRYTELTGRPRLPSKAMFGLQLSDKGHDHNSSTPSDEMWWRNKITEHRAANFPLDHVVNDNRWRAAGGKRCESKLDWDKERYPDPEAYGKWIEEQGLVFTLDFNRCIGQYSDGGKKEFNIPETGKIDFKESAPDLTNEEFRDWFWNIFYSKSLNPKLNFPGDALWIDEFDEMGAAPKKMVLSDGRSSAEMRNYWFFLVAKSLVQQGWDKSPINKRPFVWVRGMTAGAQRYATLWSGDIYPNHKDMQTQIRGMQLAGLSGFPYWGHDAGGFYDWDAEVGPDEDLYKQWSMAFGSFSPIWKPHGMGHSRWPLDRDESSQKAAHTYSQLRYTLMPYIYTAAHQAAATGIPMARAMVLDHQDEALAWKYDLQYMWGENILVAPQTQDHGEKMVWLPKGTWFEFGKAKSIEGNKELSLKPAIDELPLYVKAGSIIPLRDYALTTAFIDKEFLNIQVYAGADSDYTLIEDDDVTEAYRQESAMQSTRITYSDSKMKLNIAAAKGMYEGAPKQRRYTIQLIGADSVTSAKINGKAHKVSVSKGVVSVDVPATSMKEDIDITFVR